MFAGKTIRCDCDLKVRGYDEDDLVEAIRRHAREAHAIDFSVGLAPEIARHAEHPSSEREPLWLDESALNGEGKE